MAKDGREASVPSGQVSALYTHAVISQKQPHSHLMQGLSHVSAVEIKGLVHGDVAPSEIQAQCSELLGFVSTTVQLNNSLHQIQGHELWPLTVPS